MAEARIMGTEMEWSLLLNRPGDESPELRLPEFQEWHRLKYRCLPDDIHCLGSMLSNGARLYEDHFHPEYAAPESSGAADALLSELAGEQVILQVMEAMRANGRLNGYELNKRVVDAEDPETGDFNSWGYHENYLVLRRAEGGDIGSTLNKDELSFFGMHLATRNLYCGAGALRRSGYSIGQKVLDLQQDFSTFTTEKKPLVNLRDSPHANQDRYLRQHVTSGDPHMSPWATFMQLGSTSLSLSMMEHRRELELDRHLGFLRTPENEMFRVAQQVAADLTMRKTVTLINGLTIRPLEIQETIFGFGYDNLPNVMDLTTEDKTVFRQLEKTFAILGTDPMDLHVADWVCKLHALLRYRDKHGLTGWDDEHLFGIDQQYAAFNANNYSLGQKWREHGAQARWMPDPALIEERRVTPPQTTLAKPRGEFIKQIKTADDPWLDSSRAFWRTISFPSLLGQTQVSFEPGDTDSSKFSKPLDAVRLARITAQSQR